MNLERYLAESEIPLVKFAREVGYPISTVHDWKTGRRKPRAEALAAIQRVTGGKVLPADFFPADEAA